MLFYMLRLFRLRVPGPVSPMRIPHSGIPRIAILIGSVFLPDAGTADFQIAPESVFLRPDRLGAGFLRCGMRGVVVSEVRTAQLVSPGICRTPGSLEASPI